MKLFKRKQKFSLGEREESSINVKRLVLAVIAVGLLCGVTVWQVYPYFMEPEPIIKIVPYATPTPGLVTILPFQSPTPFPTPAPTNAPALSPTPAAAVVAISEETALFTQLLRPLAGHGDVSSVAFSPDGTLLASGSRDGVVHIWDVNTGNEVTQLTSASNRVESVSFSANGQWLAAGGQDNLVRLWDRNWNELNPLSGPTGAVRSVAFSPEGTRLAAGSDDMKVYVWDAATGEQVAVLSGHTDYVTGVAFNADGSVLASASADDTVRLWKVPGGTSLGVLPHPANVTGVAFSPDSTLLASISGDQIVHVWNWQTGTQVHTLSGHTENVNSVTFSPDGSVIASASGGIQDNTVRLWSSASGGNLGVLQPGGPVSSIAFSPDGKLLAVGGANHLGLWGISEESPSILAGPPAANAVASTPAANAAAPTIVGTLPPTAGAVGEATCLVTVKLPEINLRAGPGTQYEVMGRLPQGNQYEADGWAQDSDQYTWWRLKAGGWVRADTVNFPPICLELPPVSPMLDSATPPTPTPAASPIGAAEGQIGTDGGQPCTLTTVSAVMLRAGPGADYNAVSELALGETVQVTGWARDGEGYTWWRLATGGWARGDVFDTTLLTDACFALPQVEP